MKLCSRARFNAAALVVVACTALAAGCAMHPTGAAPSPGAGAAGALAAAQKALKAGNTTAAWRAAKAVSISSLPADQRLAGAELKAKIALTSAHPDAALEALAAAPAPTASKGKARFWTLKGRALFAVGQPAHGLELLVERGRLLTATADVRANNQLIWSLLSKTSPLPSPSGLSSTAQGWVALAGIARTAWLEPKELDARIQKWQANWPGHPANELIGEILAQAQRSGQYPVKIALLLPLTGAYADEARAVEGGLLAAYYRGVASRPTIAIYDTQGTAQGARAAFVRARAGAANFVVGPLAPAGVNAVAAMRPAVPVLALNYLNAGVQAPAHFFQFGLSPAQEARSAAEQAVARGLDRAVVLVPANGWGQRITQAFTQRLNQLGGQVLVSAVFQPGAVHFAAPLTALLGGVPAQASAGPSASGSVSTSAPSPGPGGPQFVFFAASSFNTAQLIVPQIAYYGGIGLPVYSISGVYRPGAASDSLDGVNFPIMPWFVSSVPSISSLRQTLKSLYPNRWRNYASLYALGYDAWRLIPLLGFNVNHPLAQPVLGVTGMLGLGANNVIKRRAEWAQYVDGKPHVANPPAPGSIPPPVPATR